MSVITDIAEAVKDALNGGTFSEAFEADRHYQPFFELKEMKALHVTVVPKGVAVVSGTRGKNQHDYEIDVAVQKKLDAADNAEIDPLMMLVDELADFFRFKRLEGYPLAAWVKTENAPVYAREHLEQMRQFTSVLTLTFRVVR